MPFRREAVRARRWTLGAWVEVGATLTDLSARGVGLLLKGEARQGERLSLDFNLDDGGPDIRTMLELRHVHAQGSPPTRWRAGGQFRTISPDDHQRVVRVVDAQLRAGLVEPDPTRGE